MRRSRIRHPVSPAHSERRNSSAEEKASARNPDERRSLRVERRTETSSSTILTTISSVGFSPFIPAPQPRLVHGLCYSRRRRAFYCPLVQVWNMELITPAHIR